MKTLFIVDDDEIYARLISEHFKTRFKIKICADAENCLQVLNAVVPDVAIIDFYLPGMNGLDLFKILKKEHNIPKLILLSANEDSQVVFDMIKNGVRDYVIKDEDALESLDEALELSQA